jgi:hypothetical protein
MLFHISPRRLVTARVKACHTGTVKPYVIGYIVLGVVAVVAVIIANQVGRRAGRRSLQQRLTALSELWRPTTQAWSRSSATSRRWPVTPPRP